MHARGARLALGLLLAVALWAPRPAAAASEGTGLYVGPTALPWVGNEVTIDVAFGLARGLVHQTFWNNTGRPVEAVYVFPLPTGAVVTGMAMDVGGAHVDGVIAPRASAQAGYERAIAGGHAAALTDRERPGVYTQSIAGIPIGGTIVVTLRWQARLTRRNGEWELAHPLVVGPRYTPGQATGAPTVGAGQSPDTMRAPDASRVTPPRDGTASTRFLVTATLHDAGAVSSPTHTLGLGHGDDAVIATIDDPRGNRELVLRWRRAGLGIVRALAEPTATGTYVAVLIEPPPAAAPPRHTPRSWLVAIDRSASMQGVAAAQARRLAHAVIASLGPGDRVAVVAIGTAPRWSGATPTDRAALDDRIDHLPATGGDLTAGLAVSLARLPASPPTAVVLITDGLVADDAAAIARATAAGAIIHPVGVGAAPNRWLLEAIAAGSGGSAHVAIDPDDAEVIAAEVVAAADAQPVAVDWLRPSVIDAEPARAVVVPGGAVLIVAIDRDGKSLGAAAGGKAAEVEVVVAGQRLRAPIELVHGTELATEWARQRITGLEASGQGPAATKLALERGLVSATTSLIAVAPTTGPAVQSTVTVPLPLPAGLRPESLAGGAGDVFDRVDGTGSLDHDVDDAAPAEPDQPDKKPADAPTKRPAKPVTDTGATTAKDKTTGATQGGTATTAPAGLGPTTVVTDTRTDHEADGVGDEDDAEDDAEGDDPGNDRGRDQAPRRETVAAAPAAGGEAYTFEDEAVTISGLTRAAGGGRHGLALSVGLGARVDEAAPVGQLSLAFDRRLARTRLFTGLRLDLTGAPSADHPLSVALLVTLARHLGSLFALDLALEGGLGPAFDGRAGFGAGVGFTLGRGPLGLGVRVTGTTAAGPDTGAVTGGVTVGF